MACATMCYMSVVTARRKATAPKRAQTPRARKQTGARTTTRPVPAPLSVQARAQSAVGVRELRQNLSVYLARIKQGESLEVTEHGQVVAVLAPVPPNASRYDVLLAQGLITPATRSIQDLPPPRKMPPGTRSLTEILREMRDEERY